MRDSIDAGRNGLVVRRPTSACCRHRAPGRQKLQARGEAGEHWGAAVTPLAVTRPAARPSGHATLATLATLAAERYHGIAPGATCATQPRTGEARLVLHEHGAVEAQVSETVRGVDGLDADEYRQPVQALAPVRVQRHFQRELERLRLAIAVGGLRPRPQLAGPQPCPERRVELVGRAPADRRAVSEVRLHQHLVPEAHAWLLTLKGVLGPEGSHRNRQHIGQDDQQQEVARGPARGARRAIRVVRDRYRAGVDEHRLAQPPKRKPTRRDKEGYKAMDSANQLSQI